jgi:Anti-sigma factor NepR
MYSRTPWMRNPMNPVAKMSGSSLTSLGRDIQTQIGDQLRLVHADMVEQGIPDRFAHLLSQLDKTSSVVGGK